MEDSQIQKAFDSQFDEVVAKPASAKTISNLLTSVLDTSTFI